MKCSTKINLPTNLIFYFDGKMKLYISLSQNGFELIISLKVFTPFTDDKGRNQTTKPCTFNCSISKSNQASLYTENTTMRWKKKWRNSGSLYPTNYLNGVFHPLILHLVSPKKKEGKPIWRKVLEKHWKASLRRVLQLFTRREFLFSLTPIQAFLHSFLIQLGKIFNFVHCQNEIWLRTGRPTRTNSIMTWN